MPVPVVRNFRRGEREREERERRKREREEEAEDRGARKKRKREKVRRKYSSDSSPGDSIWEPNDVMRRGREDCKPISSN